MLGWFRGEAVRTDDIRSHHHKAHGNAFHNPIPDGSYMNSIHMKNIQE